MKARSPIQSHAVLLGDPVGDTGAGESSLATVGPRDSQVPENSPTGNFFD